MTDRVRLQIENRVARVTLCRPEKYNGLDDQTFQALINAAKQIKKDRTVQVVILDAEGKHFCAGLDIDSVAKNPFIIRKYLKKSAKQLTNLVQEASWCWRELPVPVICVIQGKCLGGGLQIALGCDFRIASEEAQLSVLEGRWGMIPDMGASIYLRELMPIDQAKLITMNFELIPADKAKQLNLLTEVTAEPFARAQQLAEQLLKSSPDALACTKQLYHTSWSSDDHTALKLETQLQKKLIGRRNFLAAVSKKFMKKPIAFGKRKVS